VPNHLVVEGLGKRYPLQGAGGRPNVLSRMRTRLKGVQEAEAEQPRDFWALKNVSFTVDPGTVLGVIGSNGAGKTTLLKVLGRVITPSTGRVTGHGRVVSLLELGAGFDPELSARENILLNGAMLGVPRSEVMKKFDQILDFAETDKFVDTPLKHYSSGMYLRLAFSVAIHMEPSILLADEILAVGDQAFQERCMERVKQEAERGLSVLFVSHDMESIARLCNRALWLQGGEVRGLGDTDDVIAEYQDTVWAGGMTGSGRGRHQNHFAILHDVRIVTQDGREVRGVPRDQDAFLRMRFQTLENNLYGVGAYDVRARGQLIFRTAQSNPRLFREAGMWEGMMRLPGFFFSELTYSVVPSMTVARPGDDPKVPRPRGYTVIGEPLTFIVYGPDGPAPERPEKGPRVHTGILSPVWKWRWSLVEAIDPAPAPAAEAVEEPAGG
jgi:lipopolysaccharide transport system ATP-binding protein